MDGEQVNLYCTGDTATCGWSLEVIWEEPTPRQREAIDQLVDYYNGRCPECGAPLEIVE